MLLKAAQKKSDQETLARLRSPPLSETNRQRKRKLFCEGCREELNLKSTVINNHIHSKNHLLGKLRLKEKIAKEADIDQALAKHNDDIHVRGETLPANTQVFRVNVVKSFLKAGVPLSTVDCFVISLRKQDVL
uniref:Uncharacterized protein n=1 Tax=Amphimedon queenslandica TaxID=400682 RepID=A0A1X7UBB1_AMPQE